MLPLGVRHFRIELLRETADQVGPLLDHYDHLIAGLESSRATWRSLQVLNQLGVTRGTLQLA
jgi:putative protease